MLTYSEATNPIFLSILLIVVGYQFYFLPQRLPAKEATVGHASRSDSRFQFRPGWVWVYSGFYYPYILSAILTLSSMSEFYLACTSYYALLFSHIVISYLYPVRTPDKWRSYHAICASSRFLKFIQSIDKGGNCFPSMHVAVGTLTAIHITANSIGELGIPIVLVWSVPAIIAVSALYTKQHFVADIMPGVTLAWFVYCSYRYVLGLLRFESSNEIFFYGAVVFGCWLFFQIRSQIHKRKQTVAASQTPAGELVALGTE